MNDRLKEILKLYLPNCIIKSGSLKRKLEWYCTAVKLRNIMEILAVYERGAEQANFYTYGEIVKNAPSSWIKIIMAIQELTGDKFNLTSELVLLNDTRFCIRKKE